MAGYFLLKWTWERVENVQSWGTLPFYSRPDMILSSSVRLRLKKEFDDYKKHPEYNNFVREEGLSSSSSSSSSSDEEQDEERGVGARVCSLSDHYRRSEEEDLEVPRGLWKGGRPLEVIYAVKGSG